MVTIAGQKTISMPVFSDDNRNFARMFSRPLIRSITTLSLCLLTLIPFFTSCTKNRLKVDLSGIEVDYRSHRLDRELFHTESGDFKDLNSSLHERYRDFYEDFLSQIIRIGHPTQPMVSIQLEAFVNDHNWRETQKHIDAAFPDMQAYDRELEQAFRYYRYHFPDAVIPQVVYYNSGFNVGVFPADEWLGAGLEWFLGSENPVIQRLAPENFPQYFKDKLIPDYLVNNVAKGWLMVNHQNLVTKEDFITMLMFHGKVMYLLDAIFPDVNDAIKINYSDEALDWCKRNEYNMWTHLIEADLLYSTSAKDLAGFFNDGPFTPAFQQKSPSRTGVWLGWQIIRQYMDKNPDVTLSMMLREENPQKILKYYKPR